MTTNNPFNTDIAPTYERLVRLTHLTRNLPTDIRELINEVVEAATISLEELQVVVEELQQQNEELLAIRREIEAQHKRYRDLFEFAPDGYLVTDPSGVIQEANQAAAELLGLGKDELVGKPIVVYVASHDRDQFRGHLDTLRRAHQTTALMGEWQMVFTSRKGTFPAALTAAPVLDAAGELSGLRWLLRNLTASKRAEEHEKLLAEVNEQHQLAVKANQLLQTLIETMPVGVVIADADGNILSTNAAGQSILSGPVSGNLDAPEWSYTAYYPDGSLIPAEDVLLHRALSKGETIRGVEIVLRRPDQEDVTILSSAAPVRDEKGEIVSAVSTFQDISQRKRIADALENERTRLRTIIDCTPTGIVVADEQGRVVLANPAAHTLYAEAISIGERLGAASGVSLCYPNGTPLNSRELPITRAALDGETITGMEVMVVHPDGRRLDILVNSTPIRDSEDRIQGSVSALRDITEIRHFMSELESERARLKAIIENVPAGIVVSNMKTEISVINPAFKALYDRVLAESKSGVTFCRPDGTPYAPQEIPFARSAIGGEIISGEEMSILWADGTRTDMLVNSAPIRNGDIDQQTAVGTFQDITDIKQVQRSLQLYADRLRVLISASQIILASESVDEIVDAVLPFMSRLVQWQRASVLAYDLDRGEAHIVGVHSRQDTSLGKDVRLPLPPSWPLQDLAGGDIVGLDLRQSSIIETELVQKLRTEGVHFLVIVPLRAHDQLLGALNIGFSEPTNLTLENQEIVRQLADGLAIGIWQARLQEALRHHATHLEQLVTRRTAALLGSEARLRTIFEASVMGIALLNNKGEVVTSNPALHSMLGSSANEITGTTLTRYMHPDDSKEDKKLFRSLAAGKLDDYVAERRYVHKDGSKRWAELTISRVKGPGQNKRSFAIALAKDITQRKINQEALIRSERLAVAGRLGASLAHEINNPLQSVIGCLGLAEEIMVDNSEGGEAVRYLSIAMDELERAAGIVGQLRDLSRSSEGEKQPADLNDLLERALVLTRRRAQDQNVQVKWSPTADLPLVPVVSSRLQQVFLNLLLNAIEAMPEGGHLRIQVTPTNQPDGVQISFADTGVGIAPEKLAQIFEPFQSTRPDGLGLGLYISSNIVKDHNGFIEVNSRVGEGTTFTVWLPR